MAFSGGPWEAGGNDFFASPPPLQHYGLTLPPEVPVSSGIESDVAAVALEDRATTDDTDGDGTSGQSKAKELLEGGGAIGHDSLIPGTSSLNSCHIKTEPVEEPTVSVLNAVEPPRRKRGRPSKMETMVQQSEECQESLNLEFSTLNNCRTEAEIGEKMRSSFLKTAEAPRGRGRPPKQKISKRSKIKNDSDTEFKPKYNLKVTKRLQTERASKTKVMKWIRDTATSDSDSDIPPPSVFIPPLLSIPTATITNHSLNNGVQEDYTILNQELCNSGTPQNHQEVVIAAGRKTGGNDLPSPPPLKFIGLAAGPLLGKDSATASVALGDKTITDSGVRDGTGGKSKAMERLEGFGAKDHDSLNPGTSSLNSCHIKTEPEEEMTSFILNATEPPRRKRGRPSKEEMMVQLGEERQDSLETGEELTSSAAAAPRKKRGRPPKKVMGVQQVADMEPDRIDQILQDLQTEIERGESVPLSVEGPGCSQSPSIPPIQSPVVIGIDLGTTVPRFSSGVCLNGKLELTVNVFGSLSIREMVEKGSRLTEQQLTNLANEVLWAKRLIGRKWVDPVVQSVVQSKFSPITLIEKGSKPHLQVSTSRDQSEKLLISPETIVTLILAKLKKVAEEDLGKNVTHAVVTVPVTLNQAQRQATLLAAQTAGFQVVRLLNEPTAEAMAYAYHRFNINRRMKEKKLLVFQLGSHFLDVSLITVHIDPPRTRNFRVLATNGDANLGAENFKQNVLDYFVAEFENRTGKDVSGDNSALYNLYVEAEKAIKAIGSPYIRKANVFIEKFFDGVDFNEILTRTKFEELNRNLLSNILKPVEKVLEEAKVNKEDVYDILMVDEDSRIHKIRELLKAYFNRKMLPTMTELTHDGAVLQAGAMAYDKDLGNLILTERSRHTIGIENVYDRVMRRMFRRNILIPRNTEKFFILDSNPKPFTFKLFEGERRMVKDNVLCGEVTIETTPDLKRTPPPSINVECEIDLNGIFKISPKQNNKGQTTINLRQIPTTSLDAQKLATNKEKAKKRNDAMKEFKECLDSCRVWLENRDKECGRPVLAEDEVETFAKAIEEGYKWLESEAGQADIEEFKKREEEFENMGNSLADKYSAFYDEDEGDDN